MVDSYRFTGAIAATHEDADALVATLSSCDDEYVMFQRHPEFDTDDDDGVYIEIHDQLYSGYSLIEHCTLTPDGLIVALNTTLRSCSRIDATLDIRPAERDSFVEMLHRIFTNQWDRFRIRP